MYTLVRLDWRELSEAASQERDPNKLMELIEQLNVVLEERENRLRSTGSSSISRCEKGEGTDPHTDAA